MFATVALPARLALSIGRPDWVHGGRVTPMAATGHLAGTPAGRTVFGHPIGLTNLFGVELWERFSFYGMLTILGYYLYYSLAEGGLGLPKTTATGIVGAYGGLVHLSTV